jgi:hypothetical protein
MQTRGIIQEKNTTDGIDSVPKRRHTKFRRQGITKEKEYNRLNSVPKRRHIKFRRQGIIKEKEYNRWNSVPKRRHIKFRRQGIIKEKEYNRWNRQCSETSAYKIQTPGNNPKERTQHSEHGKSSKSGTA